MRFSVNTQAHHFTQAGVVIILRKILLALTLEICMMRDVKFHFVETATQSLHNVTYDMNKSRANDGDKQAQIETMCRRDITSSDTTIDLCEFAKSYLQSNYKVWMVPVSILFLFFFIISVVIIVILKYLNTLIVNAHLKVLFSYLVFTRYARPTDASILVLLYTKFSRLNAKKSCILRLLRSLHV